ncbi:MAG: insulinase family protein [Candidatus Moranbacteria bacterium]|nr:insulinase family protein [Candidatus Moranbacteria bacterium]
MNYKKTTLKNGLRIITAPMQGTETVTVLVMSGVGSRYENKQEAGLSHFVEHMLFKGTKKRPNTLAISEELDAIGGEFNAYTGKSRTAYYAKTDANHFNAALDVISDIFLNSKIETKEINRERGTILQEMSMYEDMPMRNVADVFEKLLYGNQRLGREIIGTKKTVNNFTRKDFVQYLKRFYTAKNTVICVAGKFDEKKELAKIKKSFSTINLGEKEEFQKITEKQDAPKLKIKNKKSDQTNFILGVRAYDMFHPDRYALKLLSVILGGNMSSRIYISVREKLGLAYYIQTSTDIYRDAGYLATQAGVEHKNLPKVIEAILKEYKKIAQRKVGEKELQKAKDYIKGKTVMGLESSNAVAGFLIDQEIIKDEILKPEQIFAKLDKVTVEDIQRVARDIFVSENLNLAVVGPHKNNKVKLEKVLKFD